MALFAEESGSRNELPTPLRLEEARRQGRVARSSDLVSTAVLSGGAVALAMCGPGLVNALRTMMAEFLSFGSLTLAGDGYWSVIRPVVFWTVPMVLLPLLAALVANVAQIGFLFTNEPLMPDWSRVSPATGWKRVASLRSLVCLLFSLLKIAILAGLCWMAIRSELARTDSVVRETSEAWLPYTGGVMMSLAIRLLVALFILAGIDLIYQRWQYQQDLRISRRQLLDDLRRMNGDPQVSGRRGLLRRKWVSQRMMLEVPRADLLLCGAARAVAVCYSERSASPRVTAKGRGLLAVRMRQLAAANQVVLREDEELTQHLTRRCEPGDEVPQEYFTRIARYLAEVKRDELNGSARESKA